MDGRQLVLEELGVSVWGRGLVDHHPGHRPLAEAPGRLRADLWHLGMAHGVHVPEDGESRNSSPIHAHEIAAAGFDYLALGHIHAARDVSAGASTAWYCGAPHPLLGEPGSFLRVDLAPARRWRSACARCRRCAERSLRTGFFRRFPACSVSVSGSGGLPFRVFQTLARLPGLAKAPFDVVANQSPHDLRGRLVFLGAQLLEDRFLVGIDQHREAGGTAFHWHVVLIRCTSNSHRMIALRLRCPLGDGSGRRQLGGVF
jgi:hypothetical protein